MSDKDIFVIWSIEHNAWWRPNSWGYTYSLDEAGRFLRASAEKIVRSANVRSFNECMIPVQCIERRVDRFSQSVEDIEPGYGHGV